MPIQTWGGSHSKKDKIDPRQKDKGEKKEGRAQRQLTSLVIGARVVMRKWAVQRSSTHQENDCDRGSKPGAVSRRKAAATPSKRRAWNPHEAAEHRGYNDEQGAERKVGALA